MKELKAKIEIAIMVTNTGMCCGTCRFADLWMNRNIWSCTLFRKELNPHEDSLLRIADCVKVFGWVKADRMKKGEKK